MPHEHDDGHDHHDHHEHADGHDHHEHAGRTETRAWVKTAILLGMGVYFAALILTSSLNNYINLRFAWLAWVAAAIFFALGGYSLYRLMRREDAHDPDHGHDHGEVSWGALIILGVPLMLGALVPSQPLGAEAINGGVSTSVVTGASEITTFTVAPESRNVLDWLRVFNATSDFSALDGQPADVIGFVYIEPGMPEDEFMAARFTLSCCVADASAIGLPVVWDETASLKQDDWVRVTGTIEIQSTDGVTRPVVHADSIEVVAQPEHPYLYP